MSNDIRIPAPTTAPAETDPRWWAAPLAATLLAPALAVTVSAPDNLFAERGFLLAVGLGAAFALILPSWFLARTPARGRRRKDLAVAGCAVAAGFPSLVTALGWTVFLVALFTGHVDG
ncbi:hypothetical protein [Streptomyces sp. NPDC086010]|uniref:hypothetical protein n=1 Tax=Streptomyces sp. NPDC086010 TaxID=3365745 RepID=UPI0037D27B74